MLHPVLRRHFCMLWRRHGAARALLMWGFSPRLWVLLPLEMRAEAFPHVFPPCFCGGQSGSKAGEGEKPEGSWLAGFRLTCGDCRLCFLKNSVIYWGLLALSAVSFVLCLHCSFH